MAFRRWLSDRGLALDYWFTDTDDSQPALSSCQTT
jgi:hypothetical protein